MNSDFVKTDGYFRSSSDSCDIYYAVWTPFSAPSAIVQIVHGSRENIDLYEGVISSLVSKGYVVCMHDQLGHGKSCESSGGKFGFFAESDGDRFLIKDVEALRVLMRQKYRRLPYFLLGNGAGSIIARAYASAYPDGTLDGLIVSSPYKKSLGLLKIVSKLSSAMSRSSLLHRIETHKAPSGEILTTRAYRDILMLSSYCDENLPPRALPIFITAENKGAKAAVKLYERYFDKEISDVSCKIYENGLLQSADAFSNLADWIQTVVDAKIELIRQNTFHF